MKTLKLITLAVMIWLWPSGARAESDFLDWLDSLSGPGPFHQKYPFLGHDVKIICEMKSEQKVWLLEKVDDKAEASRPCLANSTDIKWYLSIHYNFLTTGDDRRPFNEPNPRRINAHVLEATTRWRLHRSVDLGMTIGGTWNTDARDSVTVAQPAFSAVSSFTVTPVSLVVRPGEWFVDNRWTRAFGVRFNEAILFGRRLSTDFAGAPGAYDRGTEANARVAVTFDYFALAFSKK
jgi:hypothetical protein